LNLPLADLIGAKGISASHGAGFVILMNAVTEI
jgi:hypothetical protein